MKKILYFIISVLIAVNASAGGFGGNTNAASFSGTLAVSHGGTGATTASAARTNLGAAASGANGDITSLTNSTGVPIHGGAGAAIAVGYIGEIVSSYVPATSAITLTTGTATNVTSITLDPGQWLIYGDSQYLTDSTVAINRVYGSVSATSATVESPYINSLVWSPAISPGSLGSAITNTIPQRVENIAISTTYYLVSYCLFSGGACKAWGELKAVRLN